MTDIKPEARIIHGFNAILGGVRALGADAARDVLSAHQDLIADAEKDADRLEELLLETIPSAIRTAGDAYEYNVTRSIVIRNLKRGIVAHFSWDDGAPCSDAFASTVLQATRGALDIPEDSAAARDVIAERQRQIESEGWTPDHDDEHDAGEMAQAAACYALSPSDGISAEAPALWPWAPDWWKPTTDRRDLVKAAALILAEIERLDRQEGGA